MAFDGTTVAALACEFRSKLSQGRITKIAQPESDELILRKRYDYGNTSVWLYEKKQSEEEITE